MAFLVRPVESARFGEIPSFVETDGLIILLVHVGGHVGMHGKPVPQKRSADNRARGKPDRRTTPPCVRAR